MIKKKLLKLNYFLGSLGYNIFGGKNGVIVLLLHSVIDNKSELDTNYISPSGCISKKKLEKIIKFLIKNEFIFLSIEDILDSKKLDLNKKYIYLTFDDGYFNNFQILDLIEKYKIPIHLFVNTYNIIQNKKFWWDIVFFEEKKKKTNNNLIYKKIDKLSILPVPQIINKLKLEYGDLCELPQSDLDRPMQLDELKKFSSNIFVNIGNHTKNHSASVSLNEKNFLLDVIDCENDLKRILNFKTESFSYPYGKFNEIYNSVLIKNNYKLIFTGSNKFYKINNIFLKKFLVMGRFSFREDIDVFNQLRTFSFNLDPILLTKKMIYFINSFIK